MYLSFNEKLEEGEASALGESLCIVYYMRLSGSRVMYVYRVYTNNDDNNIIIADEVQEDYCCAI